MSNEVIIPETRLTARELVLALFDSATHPEIPAAYLTAAGQLFDVDPGAMRVALTRLVRDGVLESSGRGLYRLGRRGATMYDAVRGWSHVEDQVVDWNGDWLVAYVGHLGRTRKTAVRRRERALRLRGFAAAQAGLWLRPANLAGDLHATRARLVDLGLDEEAVLYRVTEQVPEHGVRQERLWRVDDLETGYRRRLRQLNESERRVPELSVADAARETLQLGRAVTRDILMDPMLPDAMVDTRLRREMVARMIAYNRLGRRCWARFAAELDPA